MKEGDIILTIVPQDNLQKKRPALILKILPKYNDLLVCAISSQVQQAIPSFDLVLENPHHAFKNSGLKVNSVFRLGNLAVPPEEDILGTIGFLDGALHQTLLQNLVDFLIDKSSNAQS